MARRGVGEEEGLEQLIAMEYRRPLVAESLHRDLPYPSLTPHDTVSPASPPALSLFYYLYTPPTCFPISPSRAISSLLPFPRLAPSIALSTRFELSFWIVRGTHK